MPKKENWKPVKGYEELYLISDKGRVKGIKANRIRKVFQHADGGWYVTLSKQSTLRTYSIARLIAHAFLPPNELPCLSPKNGNHDDTRLSNLEFVSYKTLNRRTVARGRHNTPRGEKSGQSKLTEKQVREIRRLREQGWLLRRIAKKFSVTPTNVCHICQRKLWRHI